MSESATTFKTENPKLAPYREFLNKWAEETETYLLFADGFDEAIIGVTERDGEKIVCYNEAICVRILMDRDGMSLEEAYEYYEFNTKQAFVGPNTPLFVNMLQITE